MCEFIPEVLFIVLLQKKNAPSEIKVFKFTASINNAKDRSIQHDLTDRYHLIGEGFLDEFGSFESFFGCVLQRNKKINFDETRF